MNSNRQGARSRLIAMMLTMLAAAVTSAAVVVPAQAQTYAVAFPAPTTFASASNPTFSTVAVATGDFNGDGKLDVVNIDSASISRLLIFSQKPSRWAISMATICSTLPCGR
jgi:hypothetical protein